VEQRGTGLSCEGYYLELCGRVQGVGLRPFIYRLAMTHGVHGWVANSMGRVQLHIEGGALSDFIEGLLAVPEPAQLGIAEQQSVPCEGFSTFTIRPSVADATEVRLTPDLPCCAACLQELFDPANRRYRYPFINCSHCGPRYTISQKLPYDRFNTSMAEFSLCDACLAEYQAPFNRRFHAEPLACERCGPRLSYHQGDEWVRDNDGALRAALVTLKAGGIIALKGIGGYHLMCDAKNSQAIQTLRQRKGRPHKPLAVMGSESQLSELVQLDEACLQVLRSPASPIVLAVAKVDTLDMAPGLNELGVMLPYSPLHHLLLADFDGPLIATSANLSGEPVLIDNEAVEQRLVSVADGFLHHDRAILHGADDPLYRVIANQPRPLRLGRGNGPLELELPFTLDEPLLALGSHIKNSIALAWGRRIVISPHIGELSSPVALQRLDESVGQLSSLYQVKPTRIVLDAHPGYGYHRWAGACGLPIHSRYHHHAHASQLSGEYPDVTRWLVFAWDGVGLGADNTLWGGEALLGWPGAWQHCASLRAFRLLGGDSVARQPWRSAAALCWQAELELKLELEYALPQEGEWLKQAWQKGINCHQSSSAGRLFEGAAALLGLCDEASFDGQAAMWLEALAGDIEAEGVELPLIEDAQGIWRADWSLLLPMLRDEAHSQAQRAAIFHESIAQLLLKQALHIRALHGEFAVGLSGGVFQNRRLSERALVLLAQHGFDAYLPQTVPINDGGLAYGQVVEHYYASSKGQRNDLL